MATSRTERKQSLAKFLIPILVIVSAVAGGLFWIKQEFTQKASHSQTRVPIQVGSILPDFKLITLDDSEKVLSEIHAKVVLINFWATWCEACMEEMPALVQLREAYKNQGFEIVGINVDENPKNDVPRAIKKFNIGFPIFKDPESKAADLFDVHAIPLTVVIDQQRKVLLVHDGGRDWNGKDVHKEIERWLAK